MPKIMEIIAKETKGKSYNTYKYSYDSVGVPSIDYDDDPNKIMKWKDSGETEALKKPRDLKTLADQLHQVGAEPLLKYFLDGSRHVFKVDDIAYSKQVFPVVAGQIGVGCCRRDNKRMPMGGMIQHSLLRKLKSLMKVMNCNVLVYISLQYYHIQLQKLELLTPNSTALLSVLSKIIWWKQKNEWLLNL